MKTLWKVRRWLMVIFKVDNNERKNEILKKFMEKTGDPVLTQCLKNRLDFGSRYPNNVEQNIEKVLDQLEFEHAEPPWLHLLD